MKSFYYGGGDIINESIVEMFANVKKEKKIIFYVHNLNFDGILILDSLSKRKFKFTYFIHKLNIYNISIIENDVEIEFKCSYKLLPSSLQNIAKSFNLPTKLPFPYKFSSMDNLNYVGAPPKEHFNSLEDYEKWCQLGFKVFDFKKYSIMYCHRDVEITGKFVSLLGKMVESNGIKFSNVYSAPSLSLKIFMKKFNNNKVSFKFNAIDNSIFRPGYYGGACLAYGNPREDEHVFHFDFSGMYGSCMRQNFAYGKYEFSNTYKMKNFHFAHIKWDSNIKYPILPFHRNFDGKLMFVNGILKGTH